MIKNNNSEKIKFQSMDWTLYNINEAIRYFSITASHSEIIFESTARLTKKKPVVHQLPPKMIYYTSSIINNCLEVLEIQSMAYMPYTKSETMHRDPIERMIGFAISLINDLATNPYKGIAQYASITLNTFAGATIGGTAGGAVGFTTALVDEFLISHQLLTKHYFSMTAFHSSMTFGPWATRLKNTLPPAYEWPIQVTSYALSLAASYYTSDFIDYHSKIDSSSESLLILNKIFDDKEIFSSKEITKIYTQFLKNPQHALITIKKDGLEIYNNPFIVNFAASSILSLAQVVTDNLYRYYLGSYASGLFISILLQQNYQYKENTLILPVIRLGFDAIGILTVHSLKLYADIRLTTVQNSIANEYHNILKKKAANILLYKGNSRKVISVNEKEGRQSIEYMPGDLLALLNGANKLNKIATESLGAILALKILVNYAPDILLLYMALSLYPRQEILKDIITRSKNITEEKAETSIQIRSLLEDIKKRSEEIDLRDGSKFIQRKLDNKLKKLEELNLNATKIKQLETHMYSAIDIHDKVIDIVYYGVKCPYHLDINMIPLIYNASDTVSDFLSSNLDSKIDNIEIEISKTRVTKFLKWSKIVSQNANKTDNKQGNIIFKDYSLYLNNDLLTHIDYLELKQGKHYAFTGQKGCGKSTTLIDLKEGVVGAFSSTGQIEYPFDKNIVFLNQKLYIPGDSTLLEVLCFPNILAELSNKEALGLTKLATRLLKKLGLEKFIPYLNTKEYKCSGGELKTLGFIQALIANPDILILDESLNELDTLSVFKTLETVTEYLDNTTVILVTHNVHSQNFNKFIDKEVHFENKEIIVRDVENTPMNLEIWNYIHAKNQDLLTTAEGVCAAFTYDSSSLTGACLTYE